MLINGLLQDIQGSFKNPYSTTPLASMKLVTACYLQNSDFVAMGAVAVKTGYGTAAGVAGTFKERVERFIKLIRCSQDIIRRLYTVEMNEVMSYLFLFDIGAGKLSMAQRQNAEQHLDSTAICGQTVMVMQENALKESLGSEVNGLIAGMPLLYSKLAGNDVMPENTELCIAAHLIQMDRLAIDSIKLRIGRG